MKVALAEGYIRDPGNMCDAAEMMGKPAKLGVMGIHYLRPDLLGITGPPNPRVDGTGTHTDFITTNQNGFLEGVGMKIDAKKQWLWVLSNQQQGKGSLLSCGG